MQYGWNQTDGVRCGNGKNVVHVQLCIVKQHKTTSYDGSCWMMSGMMELLLTNCSEVST